MPITDKQRRQRQKHIGSSDMAAILGKDPWRSPYDVWLEKSGKLQPVAEANQAMQAGLDLEPGVLTFSERELGPLLRNQYRSLPDLYIGAHIDALVKDTKEPVEAKTAGIHGPLAEEWGEPGTDQIPDRVIIQAHVHMMCVKDASVGVCYVAALIGGKGLCMYLVEKKAQLVDIIAERAVAFWEKNVMRDIPPDGVASLGVAKLMRRMPDKVVEWQENSDAFRALCDMEAAKISASAADARVDKAQATVLSRLGDAEAARLPDGRLLTYMQQTRKGYTVPASTYRVLRVKKG